MKILSQIFSAVPIGHQEAIKKVMLAIRKTSEDKTARELQFDAQRLVNMVKGKEMVFRPIFAQPLSVIDSEAHNQNMEGTFIDLKTLYVESAHTGNIQKYQKASIESNFGKARAAILKLINDARVYTLRSRNPQYDDIKLNNFNVARNEAIIKPTATIDPESRLLKLPEVMKIRNHVTRRGQKKTKSTTEIVGSGQRGSLSSQFPPELAIDGKTETFWGEIVYSQEPIQTVYTRVNAAGHGTQQEYVQGPVIKYKMTFSTAESVNQIKILPFAPTAVKVVDITYRPSGASTVRYPIPNFIVEESLDWIEYNFERVYAQDIEIVFAQESYREFIVHAPRHILYSTDFFLRLLEYRKRQLQEIPDLDSVDAGGNHELYNEAMRDLTSLMTQKELIKSPSTEIDLAGKVILSIGEALAGFSPDVSTLLEDVSNYTKTLPKNIVDKTESITKYEYIVGAKEVQANYAVYSPIGLYESQHFDTASTVVNVELETDEFHPIVTTLRGARPETSTEWSIEFSQDREVPIYPLNSVVDGFLPVVGERLILDPVTRLGLSRFPAHLSTVSVRENGKLLDPYWGYSSEWDTEYEGRLQIKITLPEFDQNAIYTIDYFADPRSRQIDVLDRYTSKRISTPDTFSATDSDQKVVTTYYPYVNYEIINTNIFQKDETTNDYLYTPPTGVYEHGNIEVHPSWMFASGILPSDFVSGHIVCTLITGADNDGTNFIDLDSTYFTAPYKYYLKLQNYNTPFEVVEVLNYDQIELKEIPVLASGVVGNEIDWDYFSGNMFDDGFRWPEYTGDPTETTGFLSCPYGLHVVYEYGDEVFGFDHVTYTPVEVYVGGSKAKNISDYDSLEQPAFTVSESQDDEYEFIHDGKFIYFNQGISNTEILVDYKKVTDYIKVKCILRSNKIINPNVSPQVNEFRLFLNTTIL